MLKKNVGLLVLILVAVFFVVLWRRGGACEETLIVSEKHPSNIRTDLVEPVQLDCKKLPGSFEPIAKVSIIKNVVLPKVISEPEETELHMAVLVALEGDSYQERHQAITFGLPDHIEGANYQELKKYLLVPQAGKDGDFRQHEYALRNNMMDALRTSDSQLGETIATFIAIYEDEAQGDVMRGYALQHLSLIYIDHVSALPAGDKSRVVKTFNAALEDTGGTTLVSTALVGLQEVSRWDATAVSSASVGNAVMKLLQNENSGTLSKISAFQIGGELKLKSVGSYARKTAFDTSVDWVLRMSAVYALGQLGETTELTVLLNDSNENVKKAVAMALNKKR